MPVGHSAHNQTGCWTKEFFIRKRGPTKTGVNKLRPTQTRPEVEKLGLKSTTCKFKTTRPKFYSCSQSILKKSPTRIRPEAYKFKLRSTHLRIKAHLYQNEVHTF